LDNLPPHFDLSRPLPPIEPATEPAPSLQASLEQPLEGSRRTGSLLWSLLILVLLASALAQLAWFERARLAQYPEARVLLSAACARLGCELPPRRDPAAFQVLTRSITSHPGAAGALLLQVTFANTAPFAQGYPHLQLSLLDSNGVLAVRRTFPPGDYLAPGIDPGSNIAPGERITIDLSLLDPGSDLTGFNLEFH
ncbi:MAG: hypothetical protein C3L25_00165, partial [Candidatus Sedimenticola endophacoides]